MGDHCGGHPSRRKEPLPWEWRLTTTLTVVADFVAQIRRGPDFPYTRTDLPHSLYDRDAKNGVAVEDSDAGFDLCDLPVEVLRHEALAHQFHAMHPLPGRGMRSMIPRGWSRRGFDGDIRSIFAIKRGPGIAMH